MKRPQVVFAICILATTAGSLALRLPKLGLRPMHCDEANQAAKTGLLLETGVYRYDPHEHHGPTLYWLTLPSLWLSSTNDFAGSDEISYRIVPVVFGAGLIFLLLLLGDALGRPAAVIAGILTAVSPAMVFYCRYYIQEPLLVFFTLAAIACGWRFVRSRSPGWAIAVGVCVGLMHATKETWVLAAAAAVAALLLNVAWTRWRDGTSSSLSTYLQPGPLIAATLAACVVGAAFYSSFGAQWDGPLNSVLAYATYLERGSQAADHAHPWYYYLQLLVYNRPGSGFFWTEGLIVGLAVVGGAAALSRRGLDEPQQAFCRFLAFYTLVLTALYTAIPYKTPWCMLGLLDGMILLAGVGAWAILRAVPTVAGKVLVAALLIAAVVHLERQCNTLNFRLYADQRNPYVYAQTTSDILSLETQMERLAAVSPDGHEMAIHVVVPDNFWPLPWYLRRFDPNRIGYWEDPAAWQADTKASRPPAIIILTPDTQPAVDAQLRAAYNQQMIYGLRPGVLLNVYVREDLWQAFLSSM